METICVASRGRQTDGINKQHLEVCPVAGKTNCLTTVAKDNLIWQRPRGKNNGGFYTDKSPTLSANAWQENNLVMSEPITAGTILTFNDGKGFREIKTQGKTGTLCARAREDGNGQACIRINDEEQRIRRLTPTECARLQTIPDWYKWKCSNAQQYKMLGNGWTVEVIKHILSFLPDELLYPDDYMEATQEPEAMDEPQKKCGNCALCIHTHLGGECQLTDNPVEYEQDGCIDYIAED